MPADPTEGDLMTASTAASLTADASTPPAPVAKKRKWTWAGYLFIAPAIVYLATFLVVPLVRGVQLSFMNTKLVNPSGGKNVGLLNYERVLSSSRFWNSLGVTALYTIGTVVFSLFFGVVAALLINRQFRGRSLIRGILTFPYATPTVAVALIFIWIYNPSSGILNRALAFFGIGQVGWLTDPKYSLFSVVLATVWKVTPFVMLIVLAALQSIPEELFEATRVDGADSLSTWSAVILPHITPTLRIVALLMTIWSIRRFEIIYLLTGGGPVETTNTLVISVYREAFSNQQLGVASTIGTLGLLLSLAVTVIFLLVERREQSREGDR